VPALALIDGQGQVVRLTETFEAHLAADGAQQLSIRDFIADAEQRMLLIRVLEGRLLHADLTLSCAAGTLALEAEAVLDAAAVRHALLTVSPTGPEADLRPGSDPLLNDPSLDESPAIVWIQDQEGRYLRVNRSYSEWLGIDDLDIRGKTDAELCPWPPNNAG
jgi:PAS domain-containing protein